MGDDALVHRIGSADAVRPVERVGHDHVHAVVRNEVRREEAGGVGVGRAVVEEVVEDVVGQQDDGVATVARAADEAEVLLVHAHDLVRQLIAERVDLVLRDEVVAGLELRGARSERVGRVGIEGRAHPEHVLVPDTALRHVDIDGRPVNGRVGVGALEGEQHLTARGAVADVEGERRIAGDAADLVRRVHRRRREGRDERQRQQQRQPRSVSGWSRQGSSSRMGRRLQGSPEQVGQRPNDAEGLGATGESRRVAHPARQRDPGPETAE